jgi:hypothetical protein
VSRDGHSRDCRSRDGRSRNGVLGMVGEPFNRMSQAADCTVYSVNLKS